MGCKAGGSIEFSDPQSKTLCPSIMISANPGRKHNHNTSAYNLEDILRKQRVYARAEELGSTSLNSRFNDELRNDPNGEKMTWKKSHNAMYKRSMKKKPPIPKNPEECYEGLINPKYPELGKDFKKRVTNKEGATAGLIFGNDHIMNQASNEVTTTFDGTFYTCPDKFYQLFTIFLILFGHHFFPLLCILMIGKSFEDYWNVFCAVVELLPDFNPKFGMADFEKAPR